MINIYSRTTCVPCRQLKKFLAFKGIDYNTLDLDENPEYEKELINKTGNMFIPTVETEKGIVQGLNIPSIISIL